MVILNGIIMDCFLQEPMNLQPTVWQYSSVNSRAIKVLKMS